jgi:hypothetical protein
MIGSMGKWKNPVACRFRDGIARFVIPAPRSSSTNAT